MIDLHARGWETPLLEGLFWVLVLSCVALIALGWWLGWSALIVLGTISLGILVYGGFIETRWVRVAPYRLGEGERGARVVFLSDLHAGLRKSQRFYRRIADRVEALQPDLIILGGDLVDERAQDLSVLAPILELHPPQGLWFILGNHDFLDNPNQLTEDLKRRGLRELTNQVFALKLDETQSLEVIGLDDSWYGSPDIRLVEKSKKGLRLIAMHEPDLLLDLPEGCADLVLLGHTHGGQIRLPGYGPILGLPQAVPQTFDAGEKTWKNMRVIISRGLAETIVRARLGSRPEIVQIDVFIKTI